MKDEKRKKLGDQIIHKVIASLAVLFLLACIGINYFALKQLSSLANNAFENIVIALQKSIDDEGINFAETAEQNNDKIVEFTTKISDYTDNIKFFSDRLLIVTNMGGEYTYIYGLDNDTEYSLGETVKNPDSELTQIIETGVFPENKITLHNLLIDRSVNCYFPLTDANGNTIVIDANIKLGLIVGLCAAITLVLACILIVVLVIVNIVISIVVKAEMVQMKVFSKRIEEISNLEGDLTKRIQIKSNNEFGFMAKNINRLIDTVQTIISKIKETTKVLKVSTKEFESLMMQTEGNTEIIKNSVELNKKGMETRNQSTHMVNSKVSDINDAVEHVATQMHQVSEMAGETSSEANNSRHLMKDMNLLINESVQQVNDTSSKVIMLKTQSDQINTIIVSIRSISKQTNLLALNAAIEASRYGKGDSGFAVVAEEVRKLANESSKQADMIEALIVGVQDSVTNTQNSMDHTLNIINKVSDKIQVLEKQHESIISTIESVAHMVDEVNNATVAIKSGTKSVKEEVLGLSNFYDKSDIAIEEMMSQTVKQIEDIQSMSHHMKQLSIVSDQLFEMTNRLNA